MKEKSFELMKMLMLEQTAGAWNNMNEPIALAIGIYCGLVGADEERFTQDWQEIYHYHWDAVFKHPDDFLKNWEKYQAMYSKLIDSLKIN